MKTTEIDWSEAPTDATDYNPISCMWYKEENGLMHFWSDATSRWKVGGKREEYAVAEESKFVSRIKEVKSKPKYSSLQQLPVGTFVKWTGNNYYQIYIKSKFDEDKCMVLLESGWQYSKLGETVATRHFSLEKCSYSDSYNGEYLSFEKVPPKKEQVVPEAIKQGWKIKHIKHPNYKCGRDVAITILYQETGFFDTWEYKYAVCSPSDMFCRKKGVDVALAKEFHCCPNTVRSKKEKVFTSILNDICRDHNVSDEFLYLKMWYTSKH